MFLLCSYKLETPERQAHTNTGQLNPQMYVPGTYKIIPTEVLVVPTETLLYSKGECKLQKCNIQVSL
jgi:hypothetical protein